MTPRLRAANWLSSGTFVILDRRRAAAGRDAGSHRTAGGVVKRYSEQDVAALRDQHDAWLMSQPGVLGTSVGLGRDGNVCLRIFTKQVPEATRRAIRARMPDVPIDFDEGEEIVAY